jgi:hypothetical protein
MSKLNQPLRLWHGAFAIVAAFAIGAAGTAIAGGVHGKDLTTAGFVPDGFVDAGKYHYGFKARGTPTGDSQTSVRLKCPRGTRVVGGGGGGSSVDPTEQSVNYSGPFDNNDRRRVPDDGWIVFVNSIGSEGERIGVQPVCVDKG